MRCLVCENKLEDGKCPTSGCLGDITEFTSSYEDFLKAIEDMNFRLAAMYHQRMLDVAWGVYKEKYPNYMPKFVNDMVIRAKELTCRK